MFQKIERSFESFFFQSGGMVLTLFAGLKEFRLGRRDVVRLLTQMARVGWETAPLAMLVGMFTGMTVALGTGLVLAQFGQESFIGTIVAESMIKEMGPVFTAFIIAARVGAAMTAELGTMSVNEEVNVLRVLGIRVDRYLVMPRVWAAITMTPMLAAYAMVMGLLGGGLVAYTYFGVDFVNYRTEAFRYVTVSELIRGLSKGIVFGAIYSSVCCYKGLTTMGGAEGVGRATTSAVVISLAGILIGNYIMTDILFSRM